VLSSAANALRALEYLVKSHEAGVSELGRALDVAPGTAHRLLGTLVAEGFAEQNDDNRKYRPAPKLLLLADHIRSRHDIRELAHDRLIELAEEVHETVNLGILQDSRVVYVDKVLSDQVFGIEAKVGSRVPAYCTALGRAILAQVDDSTLDRYLSAMEEGSATDDDHAPPSRAALKGQLAKAARQCFAEDLGEFLPDVFCVAAAITDANGHAIAAVSASVPRSRFRANRKQLARAVQKAARELSDHFVELGITSETRVANGPLV
jgi:DNA-binding IclR family transcriptional regulator